MLKNTIFPLLASSVWTIVVHLLDFNFFNFTDLFNVSTSILWQYCTHLQLNQWSFAVNWLLGYENDITLITEVIKFIAQSSMTLISDLSTAAVNTHCWICAFLVRIHTESSYFLFITPKTNRVWSKCDLKVLLWVPGLLLAYISVIFIYYISTKKRMHAGILKQNW